MKSQCSGSFFLSEVGWQLLIMWEMGGHQAIIWGPAPASERSCCHVCNTKLVDSTESLEVQMLHGAGMAKDAWSRTSLTFCCSELKMPLPASSLALSSRLQIDRALLVWSNLVNSHSQRGEQLI